MQRWSRSAHSVARSALGTAHRSCRRDVPARGAGVYRRATCLDRPLDELRARGAACGLAEFLDAVDDQVVRLYVPPVTGPRAGRPH
jgi:hypothetical protein